MTLCISPYFSSRSPSFSTQSSTSHAQAATASSAAGRVMAERLKVTESNYYPDNNWFSETTNGLWANLWSTQAVSLRALKIFLPHIQNNTSIFSSVVQFKVGEKKKQQLKKKSSTSFQKSSWPSSFGNQSWLWAVSSLYRCTEIGRHRLTSERLVKGANLAFELLRGMCHSRLDVNPKPFEIAEANWTISARRQR